MRLFLLCLVSGARAACLAGKNIGCLFGAFDKLAYIRNVEKIVMDLVNRFSQYLLSDKGYSQATVGDYERDLREFERYFLCLESVLTWETIDADIIRQWMAQKMKAGLQARTMKRRLAALRSFYRFLQRVGVMEQNPAMSVPNPKMNQRLPVFLKESEMEQLFEGVHYEDSFSGRCDRLVLLLFYHTGMRVSELATLEVTAVNLGVGELKVRGKRNKQRIIPFGEELRQALEIYLDMRQRLPVAQLPLTLMVDDKGKALSVAKLRDIVRRYLSLVTTQKKKSPHVLRHTFATVMLNRGADLEAVKELLGHESLAATEVYTHVTFAEMKRQYETAHPRTKTEK